MSLVNLFVKQGKNVMVFLLNYLKIYKTETKMIKKFKL